MRSSRSTIPPATNLASRPYMNQLQTASTRLRCGLEAGSRSRGSRRFLRRNSRIAGPLWFGPVPDHDDFAAEGRQQIPEEVDYLPDRVVAVGFGGEVGAGAPGRRGKAQGADDAHLLAVPASRFEDGGLALWGPGPPHPLVWSKPVSSIRTTLGAKGGLLRGAAALADPFAELAGLVGDAEASADEVGGAVGGPMVGGEAWSVGLPASQPRAPASCSGVRKRRRPEWGLPANASGPVAPVGADPGVDGDAVNAEEVGNGGLGQAIEDLPDGEAAAGFHPGPSGGRFHYVRDDTIDRATRARQLLPADQEVDRMCPLRLGYTLLGDP